MTPSNDFSPMMQPTWIKSRVENGDLAIIYIYIASIKIIRSSFKLHRLQLSQCTFDNYNNWSEIDDRRIRRRKKLRKMREIFECIRIIVAFQVKVIL